MTTLQALLKIYTELNDDDRALMLRIARSLLSTQKKRSIVQE